MCQDICVAWKDYVKASQSSTVLSQEKASHVKTYQKGIGIQEKMSFFFLREYFDRYAFDFWAKVTKERKHDEETKAFVGKVAYYRTRHMDDVRKVMFMDHSDRCSLLKGIFFELWFREYKGAEYLKNAKATRVGVRRKNLEMVSKAVAKWAIDAEDVSLGLVLRAFVQNVADARAATGRSKVIHVQKAWRSSAFKTSAQFVESVEARANIKALLGWKVQSTQERRDSLVAQCGDWSQKYQEATMQSKLVGSHCDALRQNLAVQLLSAEQRSEEAMDQSDKLRSCTGELWTEMHRQNLALDSLEHEVLLLEAQNNGSHRWTSNDGIISPRGLLSHVSDRSAQIVQVGDIAAEI